MTTVTLRRTNVNDLDRIPAEMKQVPQWVLWRLEKDRTGRLTKIPYRPNERRASSTDPETWTSFAEALDAYRAGGFDGVGFVLTEGLVAWDLDDCIDPETGEIQSWATAIVEAVDSYTEITPSGQGLRIIARATLPLAGRRTGDVEVYQSKRYITVTGRHFPGTPETIEERQAECMAEFDRLFPAKDKPGPPAGGGALEWDSTIGVGNDLDDWELIAKATAAKNGPAFQRVWTGDTSDYASSSEADLALCNMLAFWTGKDPERMDRLFRQSGLFRRKWERDDYRERTIREAIAGTKEVYRGARAATAATPKQICTRPSDFTDVGQAKKLVELFGDRLRYTEELGFLVFTGKRWEESDVKAQGLSQALTTLQLRQARAELRKAQTDVLDATEADDADKLRQAKSNLAAAQRFHKFAMQRRASGRIEATLREARPMVKIDVMDLDADPYKLNTPAGTVDLKTGEMHPHDPADLITKMTAVGPSDVGKDLWEAHLRTITCGDHELAAYVQSSAGMAAVGKVFEEKLQIPYGNGNNGKSTHFNTLARVMGDYAGGLSADVLTMDKRRNKSPELAELRGKRLVIASELEEGQRLDTATVKRLCSTDAIRAEKKFKAPMDFMPSHTVILHTNHLPRVGTSDDGTWRRLAVIPFNAKIPATADVKNYAERLFEEAGGAVLSWIIQGAKRFIAAGHKLDEPDSVAKAVAEYRQASDWLADFIAERCEQGATYSIGAGDLYEHYKTFCRETGDYIRRASDFRRAIERAGFEGRKTNKGRIVHGLRVRSEFELLGG